MPTRTIHLAAALLATFTSVYAVTSLSAVFRIDNPSPAANAEFGTGIAGLGDQNGDGVPDFAVGVPGADRVDVFSGKDRTLIRSLHDPEGLTGLQFGYAVVGIGDVNGDGVEDIAVGAPGPFGFVPLPCDPTAPACAPPEWGRVFVFSGATGALIRKIVPASEYFAFGYSLAALGDLNGDGVPDLAVGAPEFLSNRWGEVYAFSGATGGQLWVFREPPYPVKQAIASLGQFIAPLGDVNGDGRRDLLVAAPFHDNTGAGTLLGGAVFVLSGASGANIRSHQAASPVNNGFFGGALSAIGDQNGDGVEDYLIGHRGSDEVLLMSGATGTVLRPIPSPAAAGSGLIAVRARGRAGWRWQGGFLGRDPGIEARFAAERAGDSAPYPRRSGCAAAQPATGLRQPPRTGCRPQRRREAGAPHSQARRNNGRAGGVRRGISRDVEPSAHRRRRP